MRTIAVAGASGYAGGEVLRLVLGHPELRVGALTAAASAGSALGEHPSAPRDPLRARARADSAEVLAGHDVVVLALPHGASAPIAAALPPDVVVVDCGADHRLSDPAAWAEFYPGAHAGAWPYGLPELPLADGAQARAALPARAGSPSPAATRPPSASPSPLGSPPDCSSPRTWSSSRRRARRARAGAQAPLLGTEVMGSMSPYGVGGVHRHTPEIEQNLARRGEPR